MNSKTNTENGQSASLRSGVSFGDLQAALNLTRSIKEYSSEQKPEWVYLLKLESILAGALEPSPNSVSATER